MDAVGVAGDDWLAIREIAGGREYVVSQNKWAPLKGWLLMSALTTASLIATAALGGLASAAGLGSFVVILGSIVTFVLGIGAFVSFVHAPASLLRKGRAQFAVTPAAIHLTEKNSASYPDQITRQDISHVYFGLPGRGMDTSSVTIYGQANLGQAAASIGRGYGHYLAKYSFGVWVNVRGRDIYLARHLKEAQAEYLFNDIRGALRF